jgi:hypothetical protein
MTNEQTNNSASTLTDFIEKNSKLFSTLGAFVALSVFANNVPDKDAGKILSFLLLSLSLVVFLEILTNFSSVDLKGKLRWFNEIFVASMVMFVYIWIKTYQPYLLGLLVMAILAILFVTTFVLLQWVVRKAILRLPWLCDRSQNTKNLIVIFSPVVLIATGMLILHFSRTAGR